MRRAVRTMRRAISPRLAIRSDFSIAPMSPRASRLSIRETRRYACERLRTAKRGNLDRPARASTGLAAPARQHRAAPADRLRAHPLHLRADAFFEPRAWPVQHRGHGGGAGMAHGDHP